MLYYKLTKINSPIFFDWQNFFYCPFHEVKRNFYENILHKDAFCSLCHIPGNWNQIVFKKKSKKSRKTYDHLKKINVKKK